jgi:hypothetical protein
MDLKEITVTSIPAYGDTLAFARRPEIAGRIPPLATPALNIARRKAALAEKGASTKS